jgi:hypothetical protein
MRTATILIAIMVSVTACAKRDFTPDNSSERSAARANDSSAVKVERPPVSPPVEYAVVSDIPDCLTVAGKGVKEDGNLLLARIETKVTRITSECGCTWKWLLYRSMAGPPGLERELASGTLFTSDPDAQSVERLAVLLSEKAHPPKDRAVLHLGCAPAP